MDRNIISWDNPAVQGSSAHRLDKRQTWLVVRTTDPLLHTCSVGYELFLLNTVETAQTSSPLKQCGFLRNNAAAVCFETGCTVESSTPQTCSCHCRWQGSNQARTEQERRPRECSDGAALVMSSQDCCSGSCVSTSGLPVVFALCCISQCF